MVRENVKRTLSMVLVLIMAFSLIPSEVLAAGSSNNDSQLIMTAMDGSAIIGSQVMSEPQETTPANAADSAIIVAPMPAENVPSESAEPAKESVEQPAEQPAEEPTKQPTEDPAPAAPAEPAETDEPTENKKSDANETNELETEEEPDESQLVAFDEFTEVDDVIIHVSAPKGVLPDNASLSVHKVALKPSENAEIAAAVEESLPEDKNILCQYTFDIKILDHNGNEIQPNTEYGTVSVQFELKQAPEVFDEVTVYHVVETAATIEANSLETVVEENNENIAVTVETEHFSYYNIVFTYGDMEYSFSSANQDGSARKLSVILNSLGITGTPSSVAIVSGNDFTDCITLTNNPWTITPKTTTGKTALDVKINNVTYRINIYVSFRTQANTYTVTHFASDYSDGYICMLGYTDENGNVIYSEASPTAGNKIKKSGDRWWGTNTKRNADVYIIYKNAAYYKGKYLDIKEYVWGTRQVQMEGYQAGYTEAKGYWEISERGTSYIQSRYGGKLHRELHFIDPDTGEEVDFKGVFELHDNDNGEGYNFARSNFRDIWVSSDTKMAQVTNPDKKYELIWKGTYTDIPDRSDTERPSAKIWVELHTAYFDGSGNGAEGKLIQWDYMAVDERGSAIVYTGTPVHYKIVSKTPDGLPEAIPDDVLYQKEQDGSAYNYLMDIYTASYGTHTVLPGSFLKLTPEVARWWVFTGWSDDQDYIYNYYGPGATYTEIATSDATHPLYLYGTYSKLPAKTLTIRKIWNDFGSANRPAEVTINIKCGGQITDTVTLTSANATPEDSNIWETTIEVPAKNAGGTALTYEVEEATLFNADNSINGEYSVVINKIGSDTFQITNTLITGDIGYIRLIKRSADTNVTNGIDFYSLQGAVFGVYRDSDCTDRFTTITTNSSGIATAILPLGIYHIKEITPPQGYKLSTAVTQVEITESNATAASAVEITVSDVPEPLYIINLNDNGGSGGNGTLYTIPHGLSAPGVYLYKQRNADYKMSRTTHPATIPYWTEHTFLGYFSDRIGGTQYIDSDGYITIAGIAAGVGYEDNDHIWYAHWDTDAKGYLKIIKASSNPSLTNGNNCYSLRGAQFEIYTDEECSDYLDIITTDESGIAVAQDLEFARYYLREITAPMGFKPIDNTIIIDVTSANATPETAATRTVVNYPKKDPVRIEIEKYNKNGTTVGPALSGAQFTVKYYDGNYDTVSDLPANATRTWVIQTLKDGNEYIAKLDAEHLVSGDAFYFDSGKITMPLGTVTVQETKAPAGYDIAGGQFSAVTGETETSTGNSEDVIIMHITPDSSDDGASLVYQALGTPDTFIQYEARKKLSAGLTLSKTVTGNLGSKDEYFEVSVEFSNLEDNTTYPISLTQAIATTPDGHTNPTSYTSDANGVARFTLWIQHGQKIVFSDIPDGTHFTFSENGTVLADEGYQSSATTTFTAGPAANSQGTTVSGDTNAGYGNCTVNFVNRRGGAIPTGIAFNAWLGFMPVVAIGGLVTLKRRKKKSEI